MNSTIDYYNINAENFIENTQNVGMHLTQDKFLHLLKEGAAILDFGCGSGRDTRYFLDKGSGVKKSMPHYAEDTCRFVLIIGTGGSRNYH